MCKDSKHSPIKRTQQDQEFCVGILSLDWEREMRKCGYIWMFIFEIQRESEMNNVERENRFSSYYH